MALLVPRVSLAPRSSRFALAASLAAALLGCAGADPAPASPRLCPSASPALPEASAASGATDAPPAASADCPNAAACPAASAAPEPPERRNLLWSGMYEGGDVMMLKHPDGIALVPTFLGTTVEGSTVAVLDPAGVPRWQQRLGAVGAADAAVAQDGSLVVVAVDALNWPTSPTAYGSRRILTFDRKGRQRSLRLPSGLDVSQIEIDSGGDMLLGGTFTGMSALAGGVTLRGGQSERAFVARTDASGRAAWARDLDGTVQAILLLAGKKLLVAQGKEPPAASRLLMLDASGKDLWALDLAASCSISSVGSTSRGIHVVARPGCLGSMGQKAPDEGTCELHRLDAATGKVSSSMAVPSCQVSVDDAGMVAMFEDRHFAALDHDGKTLWTQSIAPPSGCFEGMRSFSLSLTPTSIFVVGACAGERIGTMFNSPYSRAYAASTTYVARYARR